MKVLGAKTNLIDQIPEAITRKLSDKITLLDVTAKQIPAFDPSCTIGIGDGLEPDQVIHLANKYGFNHIVQTSAWDLQLELKIASTMMTHFKKFLKCPVQEILGLDNKQLKERVLDKKFSRALQKHEVLVEISTYFDKVPKWRVLKSDLLTVSDELFTNSVFHSSTPEKMENVGSFRKLSEMELPNGETAQISLSYSDKTLAIVAQDPFGNMDTRAVVDRIGTCFEKGVGQSMNMGPGGAGIGIFMLYNVATTLILGVKEGKRTVSSCLLPLGINLRNKELLPKNIHLHQDL